MDRLGDLNLFPRVPDLGSISAAARTLDLSAFIDFLSERFGATPPWEWGEGS